MMPIFPDEVLRKNPQFKAVLQDLTTNKLNPDASSKLSNQGIKESEDVDKRLTILREELVKAKIIRQRLVHTLNELPADLKEVVDLYISSQNSSTILRKDDEAFFLEGLPLICKSLNKILLEDATDLANMCDDEDTSPYTLPETITNRLTTLETNRLTLHQTRISTLHSTLTLAAHHLNLLTTTLKLIEQTKHGLSSRAQKTQAKHLALVSDSLEGKVRIMQYDALDRLYDPDTLGALEFYREHLEDTKVRLKKMARKAEGELAEYDGFGEQVRRDVEVYARILGEVERVKGEIGRLQSGDA
ncbi:hypothetical protein TWF694_001778 [Orbilia ellipsospora]|uniref:HAUS augmin-like complex subunit 4 n=1 Tax=Orbilia ellipsospora TaxID=2528407 RepID=A0AAV9X3I9_9PEZI